MERNWFGHMSSWSIVPIAYEFLNTHSEASLDFPLNMLCSTTDSLETLKLRLRQRLTKIFKVPKCIIDKHYAVPLFTDNGGIDLVKFDFCHIGASRQCKHVVAKLLNTMCIDFVSACIYLHWTTFAAKLSPTYFISHDYSEKRNDCMFIADQQSPWEQVTSSSRGLGSHEELLCVSCHAIVWNRIIILLWQYASRGPQTMAGERSRERNSELYEFISSLSVQHGRQITQWLSLSLG